MEKMKTNLKCKILVWLSVFVLSIGGMTYYAPNTAKAESIVYVTRTGAKYHTHKCGNGTYYEATLSEAKARGLTACQKCFGSGYADSTSDTNSSSDSSSSTSTKKSKSIKINKASITLIKGQSTKLKISNATKKVKWKSKKKTIATVSSKGKVIAKKKGKTVITATVGTQKKTCKVTVEEPKLNVNEVTMEVFDVRTLKLSGCKHEIEWTTSDSNVVDVIDGDIYAEDVGTAKVSAKVHGKKYVCTVTVQDMNWENE